MSEIKPKQWQTGVVFVRVEVVHGTFRVSVGVARAPREARDLRQGSFPTPRTGPRSTIRMVYKWRCQEHGAPDLRFEPKRRVLILYNPQLRCGHARPYTKRRDNYIGDLRLRGDDKDEKNNEAILPVRYASHEITGKKSVQTHSPFVPGRCPVSRTWGTLRQVLRETK